MHTFYGATESESNIQGHAQGDGASAYMGAPSVTPKAREPIGWRSSEMDLRRLPGGGDNLRVSIWSVFSRSSALGVHSGLVFLLSLSCRLLSPGESETGRSSYSKVDMGFPWRKRVTAVVDSVDITVTLFGLCRPRNEKDV